MALMLCQLQPCFSDAGAPSDEAQRAADKVVGYKGRLTQTERKV
jgi:hypothetical protein